MKTINIKTTTRLRTKTERRAEQICSETSEKCLTSKEKLQPNKLSRI